MIDKLDHIGIAVTNLQQQLPFWSEVLGLPVEGMETVDDEKVRVAFLPVGGSRVELLEPTGDDSTVARFLEKRGAGIHHLTLQTSAFDELIRRLRDRGIPLIGDAPRVGAGGRRVAFLHPRATGGVLLELVEAAPDAPGEPADIRPGDPVILYLRDPQEKLWGVLRRLDAAGVVLEGLDLASFDDWVAQVERDERGMISPSVVFLPAARVEKILLDRPSGDLPSLTQRFRQRTGRDVTDLLSPGS